MRDLTLLGWAAERTHNDRPAPERTADWLATLATVDASTGHTFPIKGTDALDLGLKPGVGVGKALAEVEAWWRNGDFRADRDACLKKLKSIIDA